MKKMMVAWLLALVVLAGCAGESTGHKAIEVREDEFLMEPQELIDSWNGWVEALKGQGDENNVARYLQLLPDFQESDLAMPVGDSQGITILYGVHPETGNLAEMEIMYNADESASDDDAAIYTMMVRSLALWLKPDTTMDVTGELGMLNYDTSYAVAYDGDIAYLYISLEGAVHSVSIMPEDLLMEQ